MFVFITSCLTVFVVIAGDPFTQEGVKVGRALTVCWTLIDTYVKMIICNLVTHAFPMTCMLKSMYTKSNKVSVVAELQGLLATRTHVSFVTVDNHPFLMGTLLGTWYFNLYESWSSNCSVPVITKTAML